jgi:hypothetical protein
VKRAVATWLVSLLLGGASSMAGVMEGGMSPVDMSFYGQMGQTAVYRGYLSPAQVQVVTLVVITDANSGGGADGVFSGFDLDFLSLDLDGNLASTFDQYRPRTGGLTIVPGLVRDAATSVFQPTALHPGPLFGMNVGGSVDAATATLGQRDGSYVYGPTLGVDTSHGWVSLGQGGQLAAAFACIPVPPTGMYVFAGDVGFNDETLGAHVSVQVPGRMIYVNVPDGNRAPVLLQAGDVVVVTGTGLSGDAVSWRWDLNGDGNYDDGSGQELYFSYEYLVSELDQLADLSSVGLEVTTFDGYTYKYTVYGEMQGVPEPASILLLGAGAVGIFRRRRLRD